MASLAAQAEDAPFVPVMNWSGDIRVRAQAEKQSPNENRWSEKLRARFGVAVQVKPELKAEIRLATTKSNRSNNQTLGDSSEPGSQRRFIGLDLGYIQWTPVDFVKLYGGKIPQLHYRPGESQVILDEDITLEGAAFTSEYKWDIGLRGFVNGGSVYIRENYDSYYSIDMSDNMINWMQAGLDWKFGDVRILGGGGFFNFTGLQGRNFSELVNGGVAGGNSEEAKGVVKNPYLPRQYFLEGILTSGPWSAKLFAERVINNETTDPNSAWWVGGGLGWKAWDGQIAYCDLKSDAVPAAFTYSDFAGGTTDGRGWVGSVRWKFARNMAFKVTHFRNRTQASSANSDYVRTHIDLSGSF